MSDVDDADARARFESALGFVLNASEESSLSFAAVVLPVLFLLGTFTVVRLVDTSVAVIAGVVTSVLLTGVAFVYQVRRFAPLFPREAVSPAE